MARSRKRRAASSVPLCPARSRPDQAATLPSSSREGWRAHGHGGGDASLFVHQQARGSPTRPNVRPAPKPSSNKTGALSPWARFASAAPLETTSSCGAPAGGAPSHALSSGSIRWQKPQPGFQNSTSTLPPRKSARSHRRPSRSGSRSGGAGSPTRRPRGAVGRSAAWSRPQFGHLPLDGATIGRVGPGACGRPFGPAGLPPGRDQRLDRLRPRRDGTADRAVGPH